jgi:uncharacterized protein
MSLANITLWESERSLRSVCFLYCLPAFARETNISRDGLGAGAVINNGTPRGACRFLTRRRSVYTIRICDLSGDEAKRRSNLRDHEIDFVDAERVFTGLTSTFEDDRFSYDERRFVTLGLLDGVPVSIVHTESDEEILFASIENQLPPPPPNEKRRRKDHARASGARRKADRPRNRPKGPKTRSS